MITGKMGKKGQIGATLTWAFAFVVIFFVTLLFIGAVALLTAGKSISVAAEASIGGKSINLQAVPSVPSGYDPGDLGLQGDLAAFLKSEVEINSNMMSFSDLILTFGDNIIKRRDLVLYSEMKTDSYKDFNIFYEKSLSFFDSLYDQCYILCLEFEENGNPTGEQTLIGKNCNPMMENIYERSREYYSCDLSKKSVSGGFNYASFDIFSNNPKDQKTTKIKLLRGNFVPEAAK